MTVRDLPEYATLLIEEPDDDIVLVTMNRPERLNAISAQLMTDLQDLTRRVDLDRTLRAVVLTGAGRGFCAGADLLGDPSIPPGAEGVGPIVGRFMAQDQIATVNESIHRSRKPWIAAVNGAAVGGGFAIALACDVRIAARGARFGAVFIKVGVSNCDMGTSYFLPRLVGASRSAELCSPAGSSMPTKPTGSGWSPTWSTTAPKSNGRWRPLGRFAKTDRSASG